MSKTIGNEPAYPCSNFRYLVGESGMTIRQCYVMAAMQGLLSSCSGELIYLENGKPTGNMNGLINESIAIADALLKAEAETRGDEK